MNNHVTKPYYTGISAEKQYCKLTIPISVYTKEQIMADYNVILLPSDLKVLNALAAYTHNFAITFPSQERLAELTKLTDRTIRRSLTRLREAGFVSTYQRWNNSLLYKIADIFQDMDVRRALSAVCPTFKFLCVFYLFCPNPTAQSDDVRLRNNLFINNPSVTHSHDYVTGKETKPYDYIQDTSKLKTAKSHDQRRSMADHGGISQVIRDIKCLKLTKFGQIKLSAFPDGAILYAVDQYKKSKNKPKDAFAWFFAVCGRWCQIYNAEPNWKYLEELKERHHMPDGARMTFDTPDEQPFSAKGTGTGVKKTTGEKEREAYTPPPATVIPKRPDRTREELLTDARRYLFSKKGDGIASDVAEELAKASLFAIAEQHPELIIEAQRLGPLRIQSSEEVQARIDARMAGKGIRKIEYRQTAPQKPAPLKYPDITRETNALNGDAGITNLTQVESYSRVEEEAGDEEF